MKIVWRFFVGSLFAMSLAACEPLLIPMYELSNQPVGSAATQDEVRDAIESGAAAAGWETQEAGPGNILATYNIRVHTVVADIQYSASGYSINYDTSNQMKVHCTEDEKKNSRIKITSSDICPGGAKPLYIHKAYKQWVDQLDASIAQALAAG